MREIGVALLFIVAVNFFLFMSQAAMNEMATESGEEVTIEFFDYKGSILSNYDTGDQTYIITEDINGQLPTGDGFVEKDEGNIFTDTFVIMREWVTSIPGYNYAKSIVTAFPNTIKMLNLPAEIAYGLAVIWHAITVLLLIMFLRGY